jgi:hypothetical protein
MCAPYAAKVMHVITRLALILVLTLLARGAAGEADDTLRESVKESLGKLPVDATYPLHQFLLVEVRGGALAAELLADLPVRNELTRIAVKDSDALWTVRKRVIGNLNNLYITVVRYDFDVPPDALWSTTLILRSGYFAISAVQGNNYDGTRVRLTQSNGSLSFTCSRIDRGVQKSVLVASAMSLRELQAEHPREVRQYLDPMLFGLAGRHLLRPGAADVYRVFTAVRPNAQTAKAFEKVVLDLESDSFDQRERATKTLREMGAPGVLAALRRDNRDLSPEARSRIDNFVAIHATLTPDQLEGAANDPVFLLDCMDDDNLAVRAAARDALEKRLGRKVEFDPSVGDDARGAAVDALRSQLLKGATTRPVKQNAIPRVMR